MTFEFSFSDELKETTLFLERKNKVTLEIMNKKIKQIISCDEFSIEHYKNLKFPLNAFKRVHIDKSFVLLFQVFKKEKHILFIKIKHHDDVYK